MVPARSECDGRRRLSGSDVAPVREAITHGETACCAISLNPDALADQGGRSLGHPARYAHLGPAHGRHVVKDVSELFCPSACRNISRQMNALVPKGQRIKPAKTNDIEGRPMDKTLLSNRSRFSARGR